MDETDLYPTQQDSESQTPKPTVDLEQLARLEQQLLEKMGNKSDMKKLEDQADAEMAASNHPINVEQVFLMIAAGLMVLSLPFEHYLLAILLTLFTIMIALVAGLTSPGKPLSASVNLFASLLGLLFFELSAIYVHTSSGTDPSFWLYQTLALLFLFCTFFSATTYRKTMLEK